MSYAKSSKNVSKSITANKLYILSGLGLIYAYFITLRSICSGLPVLLLLLLHWSVSLSFVYKESPRLVALAFASLNLVYWTASSSYILYPFFTLTTWLACTGIAIHRYAAIRKAFQPAQRFLNGRIRHLEDKVALYIWPLLDFDGQGILALKGATLDLSTVTFKIRGIDLSYQVDQHTRIVARIDDVRIRLGRDISIGEMYVNMRGDGAEPRAEYILKPPSRASTISNSTSASLNTAELPRSANGPSLGQTKTPPVLPPRRIVGDDDIGLRSSSSISSERKVPDTPVTGSRVSIESDRPSSPVSVHDPSFFFKETPSVDSESSQAVLDDASMDFGSDFSGPTNSEEQIARATTSANLEDQSRKHTASEEASTIELHTIIEKIPWYLKVVPGPLITRLILAPLVWLHPIKVSSIACTTTGKRITNMMEISGFKKAHSNPEIFRLIRKVFLWLESDDISILLNNVIARPHIPLASDHDVHIDIKAAEPTMYKTTKDAEEILAKIDAIKLSFQVPLFMLPNHEAYVPLTPRESIPLSIVLSLPGVFNRELLTIGAAFVKASTMLDLQKTALSRPMPALPIGATQKDFSFRSFGLAVKQAAGDLAKQKGVQWGIRDNEIAKWVNKFAKMMKWIKVDIGGTISIPVDVLAIRQDLERRRELP